MRYQAESEEDRGQNRDSCNCYGNLYGSEQGSREGDNLVSRVTFFLTAKIKTVKIHECVATNTLGVCVMSWGLS